MRFYNLKTSSTLIILNLENISYITIPTPPVSIEKPFPKTHAPVFGLRMP
jgi:hypothetical protein